MTLQHHGACPWQNVGSDVTILIVAIASQLWSRWWVLIVCFDLATPWQKFECGVWILIVRILIVVFLIVAVFVQSLCGNPVNNLVSTISWQMLTNKSHELPSKHQQSRNFLRVLIVVLESVFWWDQTIITRSQKDLIICKSSSDHLHRIPSSKLWQGVNGEKISLQNQEIFQIMWWSSR